MGVEKRWVALRSPILRLLSYNGDLSNSNIDARSNGASSALTSDISAANWGAAAKDLDIISTATGIGQIHAAASLLLQYNSTTQ